MAEYIEREALANAIETSLHNNFHGHWLVRKTHNDEHRHFIAMVLAQPAADVAEVRHGYWKETQGEVGNPFNNQVVDTIDLLVCSVCNEVFDVSEARNYCPNCGAKMDGKGEG